MDISKVFEVLNKELKQNELDLWLKEENINNLKAERERLMNENAKLEDEICELKQVIEELKIKKDW